MAYFIVIGTNNDVKSVVDEFKNAHLQHNVITSGCIVKEDDCLYYQWDVFNEKGNRTKENRESIALHEALTNQISQFKTLLPDDAIPNVFIISKCFDEDECNTLLMVYEELCKIGGATLSGLLIDIVLIGYDLKKPENVTIRPHWKILESIKGLGSGGSFHTKILYVNNMDYMGAATNVDSCVLSKFLCNWSKVVCSSDYNPNATVLSPVYSIGLSEHQYDFRDLNEFFQLSAEEKLLDRKLNNRPSTDTQEILDTNYFKKIDLNLPWLDGLSQIQSLWDTYCSSQWEPSKLLCDNAYSVSQQELIIASFLNNYLKLYITEEQREIATLNTEIAQKENEKAEFSNILSKLEELPEEDETKVAQIESVNNKIDKLDSEILDIKSQILQHERSIQDNTFIDADEFHERFGTMELISEEDEIEFETNKAKVAQLTDYVKSDAAIKIMREAVERATNLDTLPDSFPEFEILNMGRASAISIKNNSSKPQTLNNTQNPKELSENTGCLSWVTSLFCRGEIVKPRTEDAPLDTQPTPKVATSNITIKMIKDRIGKSVVALKKADEVRSWWNRLCDIIDKDKKRQEECKLLMDGEKGNNGDYVHGKEGYHPVQHRKSTSLIDMNKVRNFRDYDNYYKQNITKFLERWFDKTIDPNKRMTMLELIKHQLLDPLVGRYHTLRWDGSNPFVKEEITDEEMHDYIEHDLSQSKPFVEYVRIQETNLVSNLRLGFFSNNPNIPTDFTEFQNRYKISSESLIPARIDDFVNSLCVIQIMDIPNHIDALKDFKPKREVNRNRLNSFDIKTEAITITEKANTIEEKARAIYDWICSNIAYDTTKQIHDAETCYKNKIGVCQAYCELFSYMAETVGVTADIIIGRTKDAEGNVSQEKHSWIFVYTHEYNGIFIDPTWGAGAIAGGKFVRNNDNSIWFDVSPYWMIFSHFPDQPYWQKLDIKITEEQFRQLPISNVIKEDNGKDYLIECLSSLQQS